MFTAQAVRDSGIGGTSYDLLVSRCGHGLGNDYVRGEMARKEGIEEHSEALESVVIMTSGLGAKMLPSLA